MTRQENMLEAIGNIDEQLLREAEVRSGSTVRRGLLTAVAAALIAAFAITAAAAGTWILKNSNTMSNTITASGRFAYWDGNIYFSENGGINALALQDGSITALLPADEETAITNLFASEQGIVYVADYCNLHLASPDGTVQQLLPNAGNFTRFFADGDIAYINSADILLRIDLLTGESTTMAEKIHGYYVDESYIYALTEGNCFLRSDKNEIAFTGIPLSFHPAGVTAHGEDLYFSVYRKADGGYFQLIHYRDGVETPLPVYGFHVQALKQQLYYLDTREDGCLKIYDLTTGQTTVIAEHVSEFALLEERYLCINFYADSTAVLDITGQTGNAALEEFQPVIEQALRYTSRPAAIIDLKTGKQFSFTPSAE